MDATIGLLIYRGLSELTLAELGLARIEFKEVGRYPLRGHELLLLSTPRGMLRRFGALRTVEDLFFVPLHGRPMQRAEDLRKLGSIWTASAFLEGLAMKNEVFGKPKRRKTHTCAVFVKADCDRQIHRLEIARVIEKVPASMRNWRIADPGEAEVWGFFSGETVTVGVRLTTNDFRGRPELARQREGALRPTIAAAMIVAGCPVAGARVLDPMCGVGTLLYECGMRDASASLVGLDVDEEAVRLTAKNLGKKTGWAVDVRRGDAAKLPVKDRSVDRIICNLPFGRQYSTEADNLSLYEKLSGEWARVLKPDGMMVLLTSDRTAFRQSFGAARNLRCETLARIDVLGIWAELVRVAVK